MIIKNANFFTCKFHSIKQRESYLLHFVRFFPLKNQLASGTFIQNILKLVVL